VNFILSEAAKATTNTKTDIDYRQLLTATTGWVGLLGRYTTHAVEPVLRRQATLRALHDEGHRAEVTNYCTQQGSDVGFLASYGMGIRSSHAGAPVDTQLPQGPYNLAAPPAAATADLLGAANWEWLKASTTEHTTRYHPRDDTRVASYLEITMMDIHDDKGTLQLGGGRVVYDPFNFGWFVSEHYKKQFRLTNVPVVTTVPVYATVRSDIQAFARTHANGAPPWPEFYETLTTRMWNGEI
jgi:hypothetical protein